MLNARVASSFLLSVLIVAVAAVVLYRPEPPPSEAEEVSAFKAADAPPPTPSTPWADPPGAPEPTRASTAMGPKSQASTRQATQNVDAAAPIVRPTSAQSAFVRVAPGETLVDVAVRVYGSKDAATTLWSANRDQLARPDEPLAPGSVLRAP